MAAHAMTYATRAAFDAALASGDIYTLMQGVTSSNPSVAITAFITESGESFSCGTNVMIDIKSAGPGDYVMYDTTNKKFFGIASKWIDNNYPAQPTQHIMIYKASVLPSRFIVCGTVVKRFGNRIRIAGTPAGKPWSSSNQSDYAWNVSTLQGATSVIKKGGSATMSPFNTNAWCAFPSRRYQEDYFTANPNTTYLPCTRAEWDSLITAMTSHSPTATITVNGQTVTPAQFEYSYDKFIDWYYGPAFPANGGCYGVDTDGRENTRKIVTAFIDTLGKISADTDVSYAAGYCYNYSVNAPGLGRTQWFLGTIKDMGEVRPLSHSLLSPIAWRSGYLWSSTQYSANHAWNVRNNGNVDYNHKYYGFTAVPLSDLILTT